ncbi:MAG: CoB--CoM heterodisulfide reductase iron-sulfur subunit A family protein [Thermoleophilia bacterium]|nr:CoB--CoM heterodisulfide reductase iron-sulfur subunit A family protein [Thermoleophilia bacterium]
MRIGVFVCQCGTNIAATVNTGEVAEAAMAMRNVAHAESIQYSCSEPGQKAIINAVHRHGLTRVVMAACSPRMHETTFRRTVNQAGMNPFMLEMVNIREHCSWIHSDMEEATLKAIDLVRKGVARVRDQAPLHPDTVPVTMGALVIGGGVAGIQAALDMADAGIPVTLVERESTIGGNMARLDKTFPTLDCSSCILTPRMVEAKQHENIRLMVNSEVEQVRGYIGNFEVDVRRKATCVNEEKCTGCMICEQKCPGKAPDEFNVDVGESKAISVPFPQAVPLVAKLRKEHCRLFIKGKCSVCQKVCPADAIDYEQEDEVLTEKFGAIIVATGYDTFDWKAAYPEYGGGHYPDVITSLQYERMLSASGPTGGHVKRPSDGEEPKNIVFISCVGSRDPSIGRPLCCSVGCMYTAKQAILTKEHIPDSRSYVFYMDIRASGKGYDEFTRRAQEEFGAVYLRGRVGKIYPRGGRLVVMGVDTLAGEQVEVEADLVVLATGLSGAGGADELARKLNISYDRYGFLSEGHPKLRPVETNTGGIYLAGACQAPRDIPDSVAQASAAAAKAAGLLSRGELETSPMVAEVDWMRCTGCFKCRDVCPYGAIEEEGLRDGRTVARVIPSLCQGCGVCNVACPPSVISLKGFTDNQLIAEVVELLR